MRVPYSKKKKKSIWSFPVWTEMQPFQKQDTALQMRYLIFQTPAYTEF